METHSSILAWKIPGTEVPGGLQSMWSQRVRHDWVTECEHTQASIVETWLEYRTFHDAFPCNQGSVQKATTNTYCEQMNIHTSIHAWTNKTPQARLSQPLGSFFAVTSSIKPSLASVAVHRSWFISLTLVFWLELQPQLGYLVMNSLRTERISYTPYILTLVTIKLSDMTLLILRISKYLFK